MYISVFALYIYIRSFSWHVFREQVSSSYNHATSHDNMQFLAHSNGVSMARTTGWSSLGQHGMFFRRVTTRPHSKRLSRSQNVHWILSADGWNCEIKIGEAGNGFFRSGWGKNRNSAKEDVLDEVFFVDVTRQEKSQKKPSSKPQGKSLLNKFWGGKSNLLLFMGELLEFGNFDPQKNKGSNISRIWFALLKFTFAVSPWAGFSFTWPFSHSDICAPLEAPKVRRIFVKPWKLDGLLPKDSPGKLHPAPRFAVYQSIWITIWICFWTKITSKGVFVGKNKTPCCYWWSNKKSVTLGLDTSEKKVFLKRSCA